MSPEEREQIVELGRKGISTQRIAVRVKRSKSTILKILCENGVKPIGVKETRKRLGLPHRPGPLAATKER